MLYKVRYGYFIAVAILAAIFDFLKLITLKSIYSPIIAFHDPENIHLDTKIIFLSALECKIWLSLYFGGHCGSHLRFIISPPLGFLGTFSMLILIPNWNAFHQNNSVGWSIVSSAANVTRSTLVKQLECWVPGFENILMENTLTLP